MSHFQYSYHRPEHVEPANYQNLVTTAEHPPPKELTKNSEHTGNHNKKVSMLFSTYKLTEYCDRRNIKQRAF
jgi:hypothetical protein